jgi:hypothetical protein
MRRTFGRRGGLGSERTQAMSVMFSTRMYDSRERGAATIRGSASPDLVSVDEEYDRLSASDGVSRYGVYLRSRAHLFSDEGAPLDPVGFTVLAWEIANSPVMSPSYVRRRRDVTAVTCRRAAETDGLVADVEMRVRWPAALNGLGALAGWRTWALEEGRGDQPPGYVEPSDDRPALLVTAHLWVPFPPEKLPAPRRARPGEVDVADAKRAVAAVCGHVNLAAGPVVAALRDNSSGGPR